MTRTISARILERVSSPRIASAPTARPPDGSPEAGGGVDTEARPTVGIEPARAFLKRAEVRDVLAWLRLLVDPGDAAAVVRALSRPPIELRQVELARVIQVARRRKLDLVLGLSAATESPQVPPEARERIQRFLELHRSAAAELGALAPDAFVARLVERLGVRGRALLAPQDAAEQRASLEQLQQLAGEFVRERPDAGVRELSRHLATVVRDSVEVVDARVGAAAVEESPAAAGEPSGVGDDAGEGDHAYADLQDQQLGETAGRLADTLRLLREEVLDGVTRIGGRLGELRLDTDLDISHGVARYLELLKLSAVLQRPEGQSLADALADVNVRLLAAATPLQREILQTSTLDDALLAAEGDAQGDERARAQAVAPREEHSLGPFLPRRGVGLALSASDIQTYRACPLRYKFARVLRIPTEQTVHQRFGIVVHQVLSVITPMGGRRLLRCSSCSMLAGGVPGLARASATGSCSRRRRLRSPATTRGCSDRTHSPFGSSGSSTFALGRTMSGGGSIGWIALAVLAASLWAVTRTARASSTS